MPWDIGAAGCNIVCIPLPIIHNPTNNFFSGQTNAFDYAAVAWPTYFSDTLSASPAILQALINLPDVSYDTIEPNDLQDIVQWLKVRPVALSRITTTQDP